MYEDLANFALDFAQKKAGVTYAEVKVERSVGNAVVIKNAMIDALVYAEDEGLCTRVVTKEGIGFASTNILGNSEAKAVVDQAYKTARSSRRKTPITFAEEKGVEEKWTIVEKEKLADVTPEQLVSAAMETDKYLDSLDLKLPARIIQLSDDIAEKYFCNTEGSRISSIIPRIDAIAHINVEEDGQVEMAYRTYGYTGGWEGLKKIQIGETMGNDAKVLAKLITEGKKLPEGDMDLICGPEVTAIASHESCGHPMEADRINGREMSQAGKSFVSKELLGQRIGSDAVTIIDDPTIPNSAGFYVYDEEGVKARPRYLYKKGLINEFLHNRESAAIMGGKSNASSRSVSYDREAIVRMANTYLAPGDYTDEELLEDVKKGVWMESFNEWNIDDRRFNQKYTGREAYLIENGERKHPVKNCVIETTTRKFWSAVDAVSKRLQFVAATCGKGDPEQGIPVLTGGATARLREVYLK
ncbi:MAG: TldD/PmbA family protein [Promethearchaeati archaeon SRVP18_Atabeyarchaeia-1]